MNPSDDLVRAFEEKRRRLFVLQATAQDLRQRTDNAERELRDLGLQILAAETALLARGSRPFDWGDFDRPEPLSGFWGADRGQCIDRYYIERFLDLHALDVKGLVLEMHDSDYTTRYGGVRVLRSDVLDIDSANPRATLIADLRDLTGIPADSYDCFILTQTLQLVFEIDAVVSECVRILKPNGVLLVTLPCASRMAPEQGPDGDFWRFTKASATRLFGQHFGHDHIEVRAHGNVLTNIAFLYGLATHELLDSELKAEDPFLPLVITVRAVKKTTEPK